MKDHQRILGRRGLMMLTARHPPLTPRTARHFRRRRCLLGTADGPPRQWVPLTRLHPAPLRRSPPGRGVRSPSPTRRRVFGSPPETRRAWLTPGISCERPIRSTLVSFIPLFDGSLDVQTRSRLAAHAAVWEAHSPRSNLCDPDLQQAMVAGCQSEPTDGLANSEATLGTPRDSTRHPHQRNGAWWWSNRSELSLRCRSATPGS